MSNTSTAMRISPDRSPSPDSAQGTSYSAPPSKYTNDDIKEFRALLKGVTDEKSLQALKNFRDQKTGAYTSAGNTYVNPTDTYLDGVIEFAQEKLESQGQTSASGGGAVSTKAHSLGEEGGGEAKK